LSQHQFIAKIAEMRERTTERGQAEFEERGEDGFDG